MAIVEAGLRMGPYGKTLDGCAEGCDAGVDLGPPRLRCSTVRNTDQDPQAPGRSSPTSRAWRSARVAGPRGDFLAARGRRHLRSNNSWMHNAHRLVKDRGATSCGSSCRCVAPRDADGEDVLWDRAWAIASRPRSRTA